MLKSVVSIETLKDNDRDSTYVITKYKDDSIAVKVYKKNPITNIYKYIKTIQASSSLLLSLQ